MFDLPRIPLSTRSTSAELAALPASIRRQALFSAKMTLLDPLVEMGNSIKQILDGTKSASESRRDIRAALSAAGYVAPTGKDESLQDHTTQRRLDLILQQNVRKARGYAKRSADMDPDTLDQWPAQELIRVMPRKSERNWKARWVAAGGQLVKGRMVALKTAPIWANISRFGEPFPPFDYGSGMGLKDIDREEAEALGLLGPEDILTPDPVEFPDVEEANLPGIDQMPQLMEAVKKAMGNAATFTGDTLSLKADAFSGATGSAKTLGLSPLKDRAIAKAAPQIKPQEALSMIERKQAVVLDSEGNLVSINKDTLDHWKKKPDGDTRYRLTAMRRAFDAIREPQETWKRNGRTYYMRTAVDPDGKLNHTVAISKDGTVETWISSSSASSLEGRRHGDRL
jgi:hypothetical protein